MRNSIRNSIRNSLIGAAITLVLASASPARAWDGHNLWNTDATAASPGGGGIYGTGGALDYNITCANCHVKAAGKIDVRIDFSPALAMVNGAAAYKPNQVYKVTVNLLGEYLGLSNCAQYTRNINSFAANFEDAGGKKAGVLASDTGQRATSCQRMLPNMLSGTTALSGDCHAIVSYDGDTGRTNWTFSWTAPAAGAGPITLFYGVVDGNCDMMSMKDDVKVGNLKLVEALALNDRPAPRRRSGALLASLTKSSKSTTSCFSVRLP